MEEDVIQTMRPKQMTKAFYDGYDRIELLYDVPNSSRRSWFSLVTLLVELGRNGPIRSRLVYDTKFPGSEIF